MLTKVQILSPYVLQIAFTQIQQCYYPEYHHHSAESSHSLGKRRNHDGRSFKCGIQPIPLTCVDPDNHYNRSIVLLLGPG
ncbi:hypothetical protein MJO28_011606 [Puccinia striiformis f. sp. tritici]|uniref:Uncharacterized protein n=1 Tax=Puccinia striiformis f. sp. tritici TaxID=168172 RepID=A0ACC0E5N0_9BASI|nr:hypothetical protein MJO28_011606 [Puccinia striiformis f. sp. tritici]